MNIHPMWEHYPTLREDLLSMLVVMEKNIKIREKNIEKNVKEMIRSSGKLLRPAYFLLSYQIGPNSNKDQSIAVAAALEVLHLATLIHDDVIDDAATRRGIETIQSKFGKNYAVYTGDYLFCVCFKILARYANELTTIEFNTDSMEKILLGELDQMNMRYNFEMNVKDYLRQIAGKTAQLFSLSCFLGAEISGATTSHKFLAKKIGHNIGMAFQIMDDILDYTKSPSLIGKPVLNDITQGVYSLPLIYSMNKDREAFLSLLQKKDQMKDTDLDAVVDLIRHYRGIEEACDLARRYTKKALGLIKKLPEGQYREDLYQLTSSLLNRDM